jgi:hypothetical protein
MRRIRVWLMQMGNNVWRSFGYNSRLEPTQITDLVNNEQDQILLAQVFESGYRTRYSTKPPEAGRPNT